jgi:hypothetical protein
LLLDGVEKEIVLVKTSGASGTSGVNGISQIIFTLFPW